MLVEALIERAAAKRIGTVPGIGIATATVTEIAASIGATGTVNDAGIGTTGVTQTGTAMITGHGATSPMNLADEKTVITNMPSA